MQEQIMDAVHLGEYIQSHFHSTAVRVRESEGTITLMAAKGSAEQGPPAEGRHGYSKAEKIAAAHALIGMLSPDVDLDAARDERLSK
ncbi:hypothetical protein FACS1894140_5180 [Spirochaetia bacterium]|nr:hypothetical protein FACS1894140_5180 [Spirochaetia bacterium]